MKEYKNINDNKPNHALITSNNYFKTKPLGYIFGIWCIYSVRRWLIS
jgi:hypothetical protein